MTEPSQYDVGLNSDPIQGDLILYIQRWHKSTWTFSDRTEVYVPGNWPVNIIAACLAELVGIKDPKLLRVLIVQPHNSINICDLDSESPCEGRKWTDISNEKSRLQDLPWYLTCGDLILLQDISENRRRWTDAEANSVLQAKSTAYDRNKYNTQSGGWAMSNYDSTKKAEISTRPVGIHIRKHRDNKEKVEVGSDLGVDNSSLNDSGEAKSTVQGTSISKLCEQEIAPISDIAYMFN